MLDSNLAVSAEISRASNPAAVIQAWFAGRFTVATSAELIAEIAEVLSRPDLQRRYRFSNERVAALLSALRLSIDTALPLGDLPVHCRDPKDDKVLAAALGAGADYIVTGDADLLALDGQPALGRLRIVTPAAFLEILAGKS